MKKKEMAKKLYDLSTQMAEVSKDLGEFNEERSAELRGASHMAEEWADNLDAEEE